MNTISKGPGFHFFFVGIVVLIAGIGLFVSGIVVHFWPLIPVGIFVMFLGIVLILSLEGIVFDARNGRMKPYYDFLFIKAGQWQPLHIHNKITLELYSDISTRTLRGVISSTTRTKSYSIYLLSDHAEKFEVKEYTDYTMAKDFAERLALLLNLPFDDLAGAHQAAALERRRQRDPKSKRK